MDEAPFTYQRPLPRLLSIVVPAFNEGGNVHTLAGAVAAVLKDQPYELIFVDDGSRDDTFDQIEQLSRRDGRVRGLSLSRNFGHQYALSAGLRHARGDAVVTMDADMQHPPSLLPTLIDRWREGYNVVQTVRRDSLKTPMLKRLTSRAYYRVFSALCGIPIEPGMADFRLLDRRVLDEINALKRFSNRGLFALSLFLVVSTLAWRNFPLMPRPEQIVASLGPPPTPQIISLVLAVAGFVVAMTPRTYAGDSARTARTA